MLHNELYNLCAQIVQENKSLWRIQKSYGDDAGTCDSCNSFWQNMKKDKEQHVAELKKMIKDHLNSE